MAGACAPWTLVTIGQLAHTRGSKRSSRSRTYLCPSVCRTADRDFDHRRPAARRSLFNIIKSRFLTDV